MARTVRDTNLETRTARLRLAVRRKPYWRLLETGLHLGYRRTTRGGGTWVARRFAGNGRYGEKAIGTADDYSDTDGHTILNFSQAQAAAREWSVAERRREIDAPDHHGPTTVAVAMDEYVARLRVLGKASVPTVAGHVARYIKGSVGCEARPIGDIDVAHLTARRIEKWMGALAEVPARAKASPDALRQRRATANRVLTTLKAGLSLAFRDGHAPSDAAWRRVKPFGDADKPVVRYLDTDAVLRLVNVCEGGFRDLVLGALVTGARYGELSRFAAGDYHPDAKSLTVRQSKSGRPRHLALSDEGVELVERLAAGKTADALLFLRDDGTPWAHTEQSRPLRIACNRAGIKPAIGFHILRHTYASTLAMRGTPLQVIAAQLGHTSTRVTERHYAHLAPSHVADVIRANLPRFSAPAEPTVVSIATARGRQTK